MKNESAISAPFSGEKWLKGRANIAFFCADHSGQVVAVQVNAMGLDS